MPDVRSLKDDIEIIAALHPSFIWRLYDLGFLYNPLESKKTAYEQLLRIGLKEEEAKKWANWVIKTNYTWEDISKVIRSIKHRDPNAVISFGIAAYILPKKYVWDPVTLEPIPPEKLKSMVLDLSKWVLPYNLNKTQEIFSQHAVLDAWYPDLSNPEFQDYLVKEAQRAIDAGADVVWFDLIFKQPQNILKLPEVNGSYSHPAVKDTFKGACTVIKRVKEYGARKSKNILVGTWPGFLTFPYTCKDLGIDAKVDFVTVSVSSEEILNLKPNEKRWNRILAFIRKKLGESYPIFVVIDFSPSDNAPLAVFSQKLTSEQQRKCLEIFDKFFTEKGAIFVYPVHGGDLGIHAKKLAYGKYREYDALAPEFQSYETIKKLVLGKKLIR